MPATTTGIHHETAGAGDAVVFLHGVTLDGRMWGTRSRRSTTDIAASAWTGEDTADHSRSAPATTRSATSKLSWRTPALPPAEPVVDPAELATTVRAPTLVVAGTADVPGFIDVAAWLGANMAGAVPASPALVEGAGHMLPMEAPGTFNHILERFLAGHPTPAGWTSATAQPDVPASDAAGTDRLR